MRVVISIPDTNKNLTCTFCDATEFTYVSSEHTTKFRTHIFQLKYHVNIFFLFSKGQMKNFLGKH